MGGAETLKCNEVRSNSLEKLDVFSWSVKAVKTPPVSDPAVPRNRYLISLDVTLQNRTNKQVTGLVLCFAGAGSIAAKTYSGEGELNLMPGADYRFTMKPQWDTFTLDGDQKDGTAHGSVRLLDTILG